MRKVSALPSICISVTGDSPRALIESAQRALQHSRFVELRLDWLPKPAAALPLLSSITKGKKRTTRGLILQATCRRRENGGRFDGSVTDEIELLQQAIAAGCRVVDLEIESAEELGLDAIQALRRDALLILSWHDFQRTPRLAPATRRLRQFPADFYKLVTTATRQSDNCDALEFLRVASGRGKRDGKWIVFCMEQAGIPSRALALSRGGAFVYASCPAPPPGKRKGPGKAISSVEPAAPGQIDYQTLRSVYRAEQLTGRTAIYGLLGNPVGHSLGAAIHNAAFRSAGIDAVYLPLLSSDLKDFRKAADRYPLSGFSITIPHKRNILRFVDRVNPIVKSAGVANTARVRRGKWEAINTDVEGIVGPLRDTFRLSEREHLGKDFRAVIVGTGGAARAAAVALRELRCRHIVITGRDRSKVRRLARDSGGKTVELSALACEQFDLMIHATSVGMWPHSERCLLRPEQINADVVFDLVYNPAETRLLQLAQERKCRTISGLEMFLAQAARQFEYWTGTEAPRRLMRKVAKQELARFQ